MANGYFERGEVYWVRMDNNFGGEQGVGRPGVILTADAVNNKQQTVTIAFMSTKYHANQNYVAVEATGCTSYVICNQIATYDKARLGKCLGILNVAEQKAVDDVLEQLLDLGYVDDTALKEKDSEIADRNMMIGELNKEIAGAKTEIGKKDEEIASLKMEIEMWQKCYGRCMDMLVDTKVNADVQRRTAQKEPEEVILPLVEDSSKNPPADPPEQPPEEDRLDINSCTATALKAIGFSLAMARKIVEGRPYKNVEDLKRVNGLKATHYKIMEPKLCCVAVAAVEPEVEAQTVNVNAASAKEISEVTGIHIQTCFSIVGYRKKNGPYEKLEDLLPVHGIYPGTLEKKGHRIAFGPVEEKPVVELDPGFEKVNVNTATAHELHDVIGLCMSTCNNIVGYRNTHGKFEKLEDLLAVTNVFPGTLNRLGHLMEV